MGNASADFETMAFDDSEELLADKPRNERWELIGGRVVRMMVRAWWEHAQIVQNVARHLGNRFEDVNSPCRVFTETFHLKSRPLDAAMLPDVLVACGDLEPGATSFDNPTVLFEVLSPETEARDRFEIWRIYQQFPALRHYVVVARDRPHLEVYDRVDGVRCVERVSRPRRTGRGSRPSGDPRVSPASRNLPAGLFRLTSRGARGAAGASHQSASGAMASRPPMCFCA
ncbi:Uma2 family endonuclease [Methylobacterium gossipiicola]|uniref:Endonuclease, Uma2 family (Restriction endonuclease fold) n=1 Tax=Methylobacterium gossipiicola TaxID=582675 RepID=A0A1I2RMP6_9HYPH|nr:Uma2 family endonuclease [Methylobacterium gossipiicola]SFG39046.1 Endonuclease, Uma2 family (restriction endonuclease fold) [Methylobacterium gossipiicola]